MVRFRDVPKRIRSWIGSHPAYAALVLLFIYFYILSGFLDSAYVYFGATDSAYMQGQYYRWVTCLFLHTNAIHLLTNCAAMLAVGELLHKFLYDKYALLVFLLGGILSGAAYSYVITGNAYEIGASGGIFASIGCLLICWSRYPEAYEKDWRRVCAILVLAYAVYANGSLASFLIHVFGFAAGVLIAFLLLQRGVVEEYEIPRIE